MLMRSRLSEEQQLRRFIRNIIKEETQQGKPKKAEPVPGDAPPEKQVHVFDFDDTLGVTTNANGVMLYKDGEPAHKSEGEVKEWLNSIGVSDKDVLEPGIQSISERDGGFAAYLSSAALAKIQKKYPKDQQFVTGVSEPPGEGEGVLIDFTPSSNTSIDTTDPIKSTINKLKAADSQGSDTIVITARKATGKGTDFHGKQIDATNQQDMEDFLSKQGAPPTKGVMGVTGQNKGDAIINKFMKGTDAPEEIHFYDDLKKNTDEVEAAVAEKTPAELFVYGPGEFAHGEADPEKPTKAFPGSAGKKTQKEGVDLSRWARLAGFKR